MISEKLQKEMDRLVDMEPYETKSSVLYPREERKTLVLLVVSQLVESGFVKEVI